MAVKTYRRAPSATDRAGEVHRTWVARDRGGFQVTCSCGFQGPWWHTRALTAGDSPAHLCEVSAVPEAERCRQSRVHRTPSWERCVLCRDQLDLFDPINEMEKR